MWPDDVARVVKGSTWAGFVLAMVGFVIVLAGSDLSFSSSILNAAVVGALLVVPSTIARLSYPGRPLLLLPAGLMALTGILGVLSVLGFALALLGLFWLWAYVKLSPPGVWVRKLSMIAVPVIWLLASTALWIHLDPACEQTMSDGTVVQVDWATRGFESGWTWDVPSTFSGSSGPVGADVVAESCTSDRVVIWEALVSLALDATAVLVALLLAGQPAMSGSSGGTR